MSEFNHSQNSDEQSASADFEVFDFYVAQLEAYLDGELSADEARQVRHRLMQEEAYAAALGRLHAQRVQRIEVFQRIERDETEEAAAVRLAAAARRLALQERAAGPLPSGGAWPVWTKIVLGMAACLLVGFGAGLTGVYDLGETPAAVTSNPLTPGVQPGGAGQWIYLDEDGVQQAVVPSNGQPMLRPLHQVVPDPAEDAPPR